MDPASDGVDGPGQVPASGQDDGGDDIDPDGGNDDFWGDGEKTAKVSAMTLIHEKKPSQMNQRRRLRVRGRTTELSRYLTCSV